MKIVSWNSGGWNYNGFNVKKAEKLLECCQDPDIMVIQEITLEECLNLKADWPNAMWYGDGLDDSYRGLAVFSQKYSIEFSDIFYRKFRYVVPYSIKIDEAHKLSLFAVWTKKLPYNYEDNLYEALKVYKPFQDNTVIIGDYNVGSIKGKEERYETLKKEMNAVNLFNCAKGEEQHKPTSRWRKDEYQNDYCFASKNLAETAIFNVLKDDTLLHLSDHCPIIIGIN